MIDFDSSTRHPPRLSLGGGASNTTPSPFGAREGSEVEAGLGPLPQGAPSLFGPSRTLLPRPSLTPPQRKLSRNSIRKLLDPLSRSLPGGRLWRPPRRGLGERVQQLLDRVSRQFRGSQGGSTRFRGPGGGALCASGSRPGLGGC